MRTTLTLDDDIAAELQKLSVSTRRGFKSLVNELLRRGLTTSSSQLSSVEPFVIQSKSCGFLPGVDPLKLNQLNDELESEAFIESHSRSQS